MLRTCPILAVWVIAFVFVREGKRTRRVAASVDFVRAVLTLRMLNGKSKSNRLQLRCQFSPEQVKSPSWGSCLSM